MTFLAQNTVNTVINATTYKNTYNEMSRQLFEQDRVLLQSAEQLWGRGER